MFARKIRKRINFDSIACIITSVAENGALGFTNKCSCVNYNRVLRHEFTWENGYRRMSANNFKIELRRVLSRRSKYRHATITEAHNVLLWRSQMLHTEVTTLVTCSPRGRGSCESRRTSPSHSISRKFRIRHGRRRPPRRSRRRDGWVGW